MENYPSVLIIARSAQLRSSLEVLVRSSPRVKTVQLLENFREAGRLNGQEEPALVILVFDSVEIHAGQAVAWIKHSWPQTRIVALIENEQEILEAKSAGADAVLRKGTLAASLLDVIENQLSNFV